MCHVSIAIDQSVDRLAPVFDLVSASSFYIRSIRVVPVAWSPKAELNLSLGGGSKRELDTLLDEIRNLPAVLATHHCIPPVWISPAAV